MNSAIRSWFRQFSAIAWLLSVAGSLAAQPTDVQREYNEVWRLNGSARATVVPALWKFVEIHPDFEQAFEGLRSLYQWDLEQDLIDGLERYLERHPESSGARCVLAGLFSGRKDTNRARTQAELAMRAAPREVCGPMIWQALMHRSHLDQEAERVLRQMLETDDHNQALWRSLATLYQDRGQMEQARDAMSRALASVRASGNAQALRETLVSNLGLITPDRDERIKQYLSLLPEFQAAGDVDGEMGIWSGLGDAARWSFRTGDAITWLRKGLARAQAENRERVAAGLWSQLGETFELRGEPDEAFSALENAVRIQRAWDLTMDEALSRIELASVDLSFGNIDGVIAECQAVLLLRGNSPNQWSWAYAHRLMGNAYHLKGNLSQALDHHTQALHTWESANLLQNVGAEISLIARLYQALGDYTTARSLLQRSLGIARKFEDPSEQQRILLGLGEVDLKLGAEQLAFRTFRESLQFARQSGYEPYLVAGLLNLAETELHLGRLADSKKHLEEALTRIQQRHMAVLEPRAMLASAALALQEGRVADAEALCRKALEQADALQSAGHIWRGHYLLGQILRKQGRWEDAWREFQKSSEGLDNLRHSLAAPEQRTDFSEESAAVYEEGVAVLYRLHRRFPSAGFDKRALAFAERGKARTLLEQLATAPSRLQNLLTADERREYQSQRAEHERLMKEMRDHPSPALRVSLERLGERWSALRTKVREEHPTEQIFADPQCRSAEEIQDLAGRQSQTLLEFLVGDHESFLWIVDGKRLQMRSLPGRARLEANLRSFRTAISRAPTGADDAATSLQLAAAASRFLLGTALEPLMRRERLLVVPDGMLSYIPFEALATGDRFWAQDHTILYAPSASAWMELESEAGRAVHSKPRLLAYGDPVFETERALAAAKSPGITAVRGSYAKRGMGLPRLWQTRDEVKAIASMYPSGQAVVRLGSKATESSLKRDSLLAYTQIHLATHAILDETLPARSAIFLTPEPGREDGLLHPDEIAHLRMNAELVVLSACKTGLGRSIRGEGMLGFTRAFFESGAQRLIVSLWDVNDLATADMMKLFYRNLRSGLPPAGALKAARASMLQSNIAAYRHPYYWAPFVLAGRW